MASAIVTPDDVKKFVPTVVSQSRELKIASADDYEFACVFLQTVATRKKQVEEVFEPICRKAYETHKEAVAQKKKFMDPLLIAEGDIKIKITRYRMEQDRIREAEEKRMQQAARIEQEERAISEAAQLEAAGERELAAIVIQEAAEAPAPVVILESTVAKQEGIAARKAWKYRVTDELAVPREYLMLNDKAIGAVVRAQKNMTRIPGIEVYSEDSVSVRSA